MDVTVSCVAFEVLLCTCLPGVGGDLLNTVSSWVLCIRTHDLNCPEESV